MDDDTKQAERMRAIELVDEGSDGHRSQRRIGRRQIDQIAGVRHHGRDAGLVNARAETLDLVALEWLAAPLTGVLAEDLQRFAAVHDGSIDGFRDAARD